MDVFTTILQSNLTPITLSLTSIALIVLSFIRGWILPQSTVTLLLGAKDATIDHYKRAYEAQLARSDKQQEILEKLLTYAEGADKVLTAIQQKNEGATP